MSKTKQDQDVTYYRERVRVEDAKRVLTQRIRITTQRLRSHIRALDKHEECLLARFRDGQIELSGMDAIQASPEVDAILSDPTGVV